MNIIIKSLTTETAADFFDFFDNRAFTDRSGAFCYCTWFHCDCSIDEHYAQGKDSMRAHASELITSGQLHGYLAYYGETAVGWCNAGDRAAYRRLNAEYGILEKNTQRIKAVACFEIAPEYRGMGIATALLNIVVADAQAEGYAAVEGYPKTHGEFDPFDYSGPVRLFEKAGFTPSKQKNSTLTMRKYLL